MIISARVHIPLLQAQGLREDKNKDIVRKELLSRIN
jgi:hypothetical protein